MELQPLPIIALTPEVFTPISAVGRVSAQEADTVAVLSKETQMVGVNKFMRRWSHEYVLRDHLGGMRVRFRAGSQTANPTATVYQYASYYPYGMEHGGQSYSRGDRDDELFHGKRLDEGHGLDWHHYGWRYYDAEIGRWTMVDPADEFSTAYAYVGADPVNFTDPDGAQAECASHRNIWGPCGEGNGRRQNSILEGYPLDHHFETEAAQKFAGRRREAMVGMEAPAASLAALKGVRDIFLALDSTPLLGVPGNRKENGVRHLAFAIYATQRVGYENAQLILHGHEVYPTAMFEDYADLTIMQQDDHVDMLNNYIGVAHALGGGDETASVGGALFDALHIARDSGFYMIEVGANRDRIHYQLTDIEYDTLYNHFVDLGYEE
ncbi:MAG: RHS repeat-associated core domain-containing protein [Bacteroidota bacterium]